MGDDGIQLSERSVAVLEMIAAGSTYEQILAALPKLTYFDIFRAAEEALNALARTQRGPGHHVANVRKHYPRAYEKWTDSEERQLRAFIDGGLTVAQISHRLQRQRSAIRSRIVKLDLISRLSPHEQSELLRISKLDSADADPSDER